MNKRILTIMLLGVLVLSACGSKVQEPITIGVVAPLTGGPALWGQGSVNMIELAAHEINAQGGINGRMLHIVAEDGKCSTAQATTAAQKLIDIDGTSFILGGHCSTETAGVVSVASARNVFSLAGVSTATGLLDAHPQSFRTSPANLVQAGYIADIALDEELNTVAVLVAQTAFSESIANDFVAAYTAIGGEVVTVEKYAWPESKDFRTELLKIKALNPDAIFVSPMGDEKAIIMQQIQELGIDSQLTGNTIFVSSRTPGLPEDAFTVAPYANPQGSLLVAKYQKAYGSDVPYNLFFVGAAYDGMYMLADALESCSEDVVCVTSYFNGLTYEGEVARYIFDGKGDPVLNNWRRQQVVDSTNVFTSLQ